MLKTFSKWYERFEARGFERRPGTTKRYNRRANVRLHTATHEYRLVLRSLKPARRDVNHLRSLANERDAFLAEFEVK